jgi:hypothetical protein
MEGQAAVGASGGTGLGMEDNEMEAVSFLICTIWRWVSEHSSVKNRRCSLLHDRRLSCGMATALDGMRDR